MLQESQIQEEEQYEETAAEEVVVEPARALERQLRVSDEQH